MDLLGTMMSERRLIERAFQLAETGELTSTSELRQRLKHEGYAEVTISVSLHGPFIRRQLRETISAAVCRRASQATA
jgi:hypothetical protein